MAPSVARLGFLVLLWLAILSGVTWGVGPESGWLEDWMRWDGQWYQSIWNGGYRAAPHTIVFPPLYPMLVGILSTITTLPFGLAAILLNLAALFGACLCLSRLYENRLGMAADAPTAFLLTFPALYFVFAPYSDTLFLYVTLQILVLSTRPANTLSRGEHLLLVVLLFCAPLVRVTGVVFLGLLAFRRWHALATAGGVAVWLVVNYWVAGSPLAFIEVQQESPFLMPEGGPLKGLSYALSGLQQLPQAGGYSDWIGMHLLPIGILVLTGILAAWLAARREWILLYTLLAIVLISHGQAFWRSVVRYDMPIWPFLAAPFLSVLQRTGDKDRVTGLDRSLRWAASSTLLILGVIGLVLQASYAHRFVRGGWAF